MISAGACFGAVACGSSDSGARASDQNKYFPQSVASGDPRPNSVVLWTRVDDAARASDDLTLILEVATDEGFGTLVMLDGNPSQTLTAKAEFDHCVKARIDGLIPATTYFYRFSYEISGSTILSRTGRTKTAPDENADVAVRFAVVSCQDYAGKYYHSYRHLAEQDLDVIVHLGDYIYETTADPSFQTETQDRQVVFSNPSEALMLGSADAPFFAAQSLGNYRDLYRLYRSDPDMQAVHEQFPIIATQDDHEFSDDCHADFATYTDGREPEQETARRLAADQAWFEYMPVDLSSVPTSDWDGSKAFPDELRYYRNFVFGQHFELVLTDLRRYRPDHLVPEDAFPGSIFLDQAALTALEGTLPGDAAPYVDLDADENKPYRDALQTGADTLSIDASAVKGLISVAYINDSLTTLGLSDPPPIDATAPDLERGYAYEQLLKSDEFSRIGSRYVVAVAQFNALAQSKYQDSMGASEQLMGADQRAWFLATMKASTRTFKVWGNEVCFMQRHIDLSQVTLAPEELRIKIQISAEDWDGFPNEREALLDELGALDNVVIVSGDLHCFFAGTPYSATDSSKRLVEFVTGSLTSTTWQQGLLSLASSSDLPPSTQFIAESVGSLLTDPDTKPNPHLAFQNLSDNGYGLFEANGERLAVSLFSISPENIAKPPAALSGALDGLFARQDFEVVAGAPDLFRNNSDGTRERWDIPSVSWVPA
ncbi:MAG TPA: alkaline phosphatase D family protein [Polyangiaceae bacterium]|nr:alkaline phosphatase D family protein [Polyangiaceae bacterium]